MTLVLFDCDGTIVDSQATIVRAMTEAFQVVRRPAPRRQEILSIVGLSLPRAMAVLAPAAAESEWATLVDEYRLAAQKIRLETAEDPLYDGADEAIRRLARNDALLLGIAYGAWNVYTEHKLPNGSVLLLMFGVIVFLVGLVSEQIAAMRGDGRR